MPSILGTPGLSGRGMTSASMATSHYDASEYVELLKNSFMEYLNGNIVRVVLACPQSIMALPSRKPLWTRVEQTFLLSHSAGA